MTLTNLWSLQARYVFPMRGDDPPLENGIVSLAGDRIVDVGRAAPTGTPTRLGNVAILPGLVNAHTHLEFSDLRTPLGQPAMRMPDWIRMVVAHRRDAASNEAMMDVIHRGLRECLSSGTTMIGEIASDDWLGTASDTRLGSLVVFRELLGLAEERTAALLQLARSHLDAVSQHCQAGLSPHAPYTVHPELVRGACQLSRQQRVPVAMHLAESPEELELLADQSGPLVSLLESLGAWHPEILTTGRRPLDYLRILARAHRTLIIHGNYLRPDERAFLAERRDRMSVVYCPRTHAYFGHDRYPLATLLAEGIHVALGTDSRASNPDLDLLAEMRFVRDTHSNVAPADIVRMGSLWGAQALGLSDRGGTLAAGRRADLTIVELPARTSGDPFELLLSPEARVRDVYVGGRSISQTPGFSDCDGGVW